MKQALAIVGAGLAALATSLLLRHIADHTTRHLQQVLDTGLIQVLTGAVFFGVLLLFCPEVFKGDAKSESRPADGPADFSIGKTPQETAEKMARRFSGVTDEASRREAIRGWLLAVPQCTVLIPLIFYLRFGTIDPLAWGLTVFFDVYCLLWALGLFFLPKSEYHSPVALRGDWRDRVGAFWLVGCAFGPFFGWILTEALPVAPGSWRILYFLRLFLAAVLPIILALPLLRYIRGKSTAVALPLLLIITLIPVSTAMGVSRDLWEGPVLRSDAGTGGAELYLRHTGRSLGTAP